MTKRKQEKPETKRTDPTLYIGGEEVSVSPSAITSSEGSDSEEQVKKGLKLIQKKSIFPTPVTSG